MTMKSVDLPHLRSVVLAGHAGAGKTTLAEQLMFKAGGHPPARARGRRDGASRFRARRAATADVAEPCGRHVRARRDADLARRHAGLHRLRRRRHRGLRGDGRRDPRDGCLGRCRGGPREGRGPRAFDHDRDLLLHQQVRSRERRSDRGRWTRSGRASARRSRHSSSRSARPSRSMASSTSFTARRTAGMVRPRSRSRFPTTWPRRSRAGATSFSKPPPKPTTTC